MTIFPTKKYYLKLIDNQATTLHQLENNTKKSHRFEVSSTNKKFLGIIHGYAFKLICPHSHFGILTIMNGKIHEKEMHVVFEYRRSFKIMMAIFICFFSIQCVIDFFSKSSEIMSLPSLGMLALILMLLFVIPKMLFIMASRKCLEILRNTLKIEELKTS
ncbi:hypothetical protein [Kordia sp.]|uniref:hypothetical protein n=1 Tax=Kordia sp. TaxID=1965332 RepID=UPI0025BD42EB|nr:hypothetical protein [Kordia sp.]MCH2196364.1 hypothetical protein [Kordia sp.]